MMRTSNKNLRNDVLKELGNNTYVKIPSVPEGFKAMQELKKEGIKLTATAVYTPMQAFLAAKSGASYVAPYINRIDNMGYNGIQAAKKSMIFSETFVRCFQVSLSAYSCSIQSENKRRQVDKKDSTQ
ncbi:transaldolase family protein [Anaerostipes faecis]|uniref:transaldolase family protein n=1 Tax=Anaerostipes faecis TaxID=2880702 RepID=UPI002ED11592